MSAFNPINDRVKVKTEGNTSTVYLDGIPKAKFKDDRHRGRANDVALGIKIGIPAKMVQRNE